MPVDNLACAKVAHHKNPVEARWERKQSVEGEILPQQKFLLPPPSSPGRGSLQVLGCRGPDQQFGQLFSMCLRLSSSGSRKQSNRKLCRLLQPAFGEVLPEINQTDHMQETNCHTVAIYKCYLHSIRLTAASSFRRSLSTRDWSWTWGGERRLLKQMKFKSAAAKMSHEKYSHSCVHEL